MGQRFDARLGRLAFAQVGDEHRPVDDVAAIVTDRIDQALDRQQAAVLAHRPQFALPAALGFERGDDRGQRRRLLETVDEETRQTALQLIERVAADLGHRPVDRQHLAIAVENQHRVAGMVEEMGDQALPLLGFEALAHVPGDAGQAARFAGIAVDGHAQELERTQAALQLQPDQLAHRRALAIDGELAVTQAPGLVRREQNVDRTAHHLVHRTLQISAKSLVDRQKAAVVVEQPGRIGNRVEQRPRLTRLFLEGPGHPRRQRLGLAVAARPCAQQRQQRGQQDQAENAVNGGAALPLGEHVGLGEADGEYEGLIGDLAVTENARLAIEPSLPAEGAGGFAGGQAGRDRAVEQAQPLLCRQLRPAREERHVAAPQGDDAAASEIESLVVMLEVIGTQRRQHDAGKIAGGIVDAPGEDDDDIAGDPGNDRLGNHQTGVRLAAQADEIVAVADVDCSQCAAGVVEVVAAGVGNAEAVHFGEGRLVAAQLGLDLSTRLALEHRAPETRREIEQMLVDLPDRGEEMAFEQRAQRAAEAFGRGDLALPRLLQVKNDPAEQAEKNGGNKERTETP